MYGIVALGCGLTDGSAAGDWRLPNRKELHSLTDFSQYSPALPSGYDSYFINVQWGDYHDYWSSTTYPNFTNLAWFFSMEKGFIFVNNKTVDYYVWPVCGP